MLSLVDLCFGWLPPSLRVLVSAVICIFGILVFFDVVKLIFELLHFFLDVIAGLFGKVVAFFV